MLSYQHIYHAGNFADVHKHAVLARLIKAQKAKPGSFELLDTHAGRGLYDLGAEEAQRNREFENGIGKFFGDKFQGDKFSGDGGGPLQDYLGVVRKFNPDGALRLYPGSALLARELMRPADRLVCAELHPGEFSELKKSLYGAPNTQLAQSDGLEALAAEIPFATRRGLVVIDPSYEIKTEYAALAKHLQRAWKKWPTGIFMIWYPMLEAGGHLRFLAALRETTVKDVLVSQIELDGAPKEHYRMAGSGVAVINPPWRAPVLAELTDTIAAGLAARGRVFWLDNLRINPETGELDTGAEKSE